MSLDHGKIFFFLTFWEKLWLLWCQSFFRHSVCFPICKPKSYESQSPFWNFPWNPLALNEESRKLNYKMYIFKLVIMLAKVLWICISQYFPCNKTTFWRGTRAYGVRQYIELYLLACKIRSRKILKEKKVKTITI